MFVQLKAFPDHMITDDGKVISLKNGKWYEMSGGVNSSGYNVVSLSYPGTQYRKTVHQLVAEVFLGERPEGFDINHKDGNKLNNALSNLEYTTRQDNCKHAWNNGLHEATRASTVKRRTKLSGEDVERLKALKGKITQKEAAATFGVCQPYVSGIWSGRYRG